MPSTNLTPQAFAVALLRTLGIKPNSGNVRALVGWERAEGGHWNNDAQFNPLNTTQPEQGAGNTGSQGNIKVYRSWDQGLQATAQTLRNGRYGAIINALRGSDPGAVAQAIGSSPWGTSAGLVAKTIGATPKSAVPASEPTNNNAARGARAASVTSVATPGVDNSGARAAAISQFLGTKDANPVDFAMQFRALADTPGSSAPVGQQVATTGLPTARSPRGSSGYVNPFEGSLVSGGRVDEGVDPTIRGPIRAIGDARVVNISHNFYKGQPYIVYQLLGGQHAGKYVYVSELVTPHVKVGQRLRAGDVVATGHGAIETGWAGGATGAYMPLANRAQGGDYTEGKATAHGQSFLRFLQQLGAKAGPG